MRKLLSISLLTLVLGLANDPAEGPFIAKPYLQLGDAPTLLDKEQMWVLWHSPDSDLKWGVEFRPVNDAKWTSAKAELVRTVRAGVIATHRVYGAKLEGLVPGSQQQYRVLVDGKPVFESTFQARKPGGTPVRFVVFGDCAAGTMEQRAIAFQTHRAKPDFVAIAGDIVYSRGLISEYREKYFPIYNADSALAERGAPLTRSTLFMSAPGNHDVGGADLGRTPDGLAYYLYWAQPLNGPLTKPSEFGATPLAGNTAAFLKSAGSQFPRMANFSYDYGDTHWTVIDSNKYVDWNTPVLRDWLKNDLAAAAKAKWRFVIYHHPGFNSSKAHYGDQWMRLLSPIFEEGKVDIVFAGHVHNYQRSHPLTFVPESTRWQARVDGAWVLDKSFNGTTRTKPKGVLYLVSGAGGARLYNTEQQGDSSSLQPFTSKFISQVNSLTVVDADAEKLTVRQIDVKGKEVDHFTVTR